MPHAHQLSASTAAALKLQQALGQAFLTLDEAMFLMVFIFRPFLSLVLQHNQEQAQHGASSSVAALGLHLVHLLHHVLQSLSTAQQHNSAEQQNKLQRMADTLLLELAALNMYTIDRKAAAFLEGSRRTLTAYMKATPGGRQALPSRTANASSNSSSGGIPGASLDKAPGVQALLCLLCSSTGARSKHTDSVLAVLDQLLRKGGAAGAAASGLDSVVVACCAADTTPLWQHWLRGPLIQAITPASLACSVRQDALQGAVGRKSFTLNLSSAGSRSTSTRAAAAAELEVTWSDLSTQTIKGGHVPARYPIEQLLLGPGGVLGWR